MGMALAVLFDEDCGICVKSARWIQLLDKKGKTECIPALGDESRERYPNLDPFKLMEALHAIDEKDRVFIGHEAFREILKRLPLFPLSWFWAIPGFSIIANKGYQLVADNRPRTCRLDKKSPTN